MHKRSKNIEKKLLFVWDKTENGTISIHYVLTDEMAANIFMNFLPVTGLNIQNSFDENRPFAISSILIGVLEFRSNCSVELS